MKRKRWTPILAVGLTVGLVTGCETGTEVQEPETFDAEAALADYRAMDSVLSSTTLGDFQAMAGGITLETFGPEVRRAMSAATVLATSSAAPSGQPLAGALAGLGAGLDPVALQNPIISAFRRGKTFVYDADKGRYVMDEGRDGAPETGVRFILYRAGPDGKPDPDQETGYADLIDEGDHSAEEIALRLQVVEDGETVIEYGTTVDFLANGGRVTAEGFIQGPLNRLDFDLEVHASGPQGGSTLDIEFQMGIASRNFFITGSALGVEEDDGSGGQVDLSVQHGTNRFDLSLTSTESSIDGTLELNGDLFATVTGDPDAPTFTGATGNPLTFGETVVVGHVILVSNAAFGLFEILLHPVDELVIIALLL